MPPICCGSSTSIPTDSRREEPTDREALRELGDVISGIVYLSPGEGRELLRLALEFLKSREVKRPGQQAWEYATIAYNAEKAGQSHEKPDDE